MYKIQYDEMLLKNWEEKKSLFGIENARKKMTAMSENAIMQKISSGISELFNWFDMI